MIIAVVLVSLGLAIPALVIGIRRKRRYAIVLSAIGLVFTAYLFVSNLNAASLGLIIYFLPVIFGAVALVVALRNSEKRPRAQVALDARTNTLAIVAFVLAFFVAVGGIICGHIALAQINRTGEAGRGLAIAALWVGYVFVGIYVAGFIALAIIGTSR